MANTGFLICDFVVSNDKTQDYIILTCTFWQGMAVSVLMLVIFLSYTVHPGSIKKHYLVICNHEPYGADE